MSILNFKSKNYSHKAKDSCALRLLCAVIAHKDGAADVRGYVVRGDDAVVPARCKFIFPEPAVDERRTGFRGYEARAARQAYIEIPRVKVGFKKSCNGFPFFDSAELV